MLLDALLLAFADGILRDAPRGCLDTCAIPQRCVDSRALKFMYMHCDGTNHHPQD